jgi:ADP-ribose pyrophosphatase
MINFFHKGKFLEFVEQDGYEFVRRNRGSGVVTILAETPDREILLIEQTRIPMGRRVLEFPAGLVGDDQPESEIEAVKRELLEETGYEAIDIHKLFNVASSSGLTNEIISMYAVHTGEQVTNNLGVGHEDIILHKIREEIFSEWVLEKTLSGELLVDGKVAMMALANGMFS